MEKIVVNTETLEQFKNDFVKSNEKISGILNEMSDNVFKYSESMVSDASEKFKEFMVQKLREEVDVVGNVGLDIEEKLNMIIKTYNETYEEIRRSVGE